MTFAAQKPDQKLELVTSRSTSDNRFPERLNLLVEEFYAKSGRRSKKAFADQCGTTDTTINKYLEGLMLPKKDKLKAIASAFNVSLEWLEDGIEPMRPNPAPDDKSLLAPPKIALTDLEEGQKKTLADWMNWRTEMLAQAFLALDKSVSGLPQERRPSPSDLLLAAKAAVEIPFS